MKQLLLMVGGHLYVMVRIGLLQVRQQEQQMHKLKELSVKVTALENA